MKRILKKYFYYKCPGCKERTIPYIQIFKLLSPKYCPVCKIYLLPKNIREAFRMQVLLIAVFFIILRLYLWGSDFLEKATIFSRKVSMLIQFILGGILLSLYMLTTIICDTQVTELGEIENLP
ncbi:MAG: hypothetical protein ABRQ38_18745 [Candidatus Eremiobacterota bacterium]